jgi:GH15 family glucan-1,4-alpha-glucosidase
VPRDIPVGNGNLLVAFDNTYQLREFFYPYVGQANHTLGEPFHFGVWVDGKLAWITDPEWERDLRYETDTLVTRVRLVNRPLGIAITCSDCVDFDLDLYLRRMEFEDVREEGGGPREVRVFFHHAFQIGGAGEGDTAYYYPQDRSLRHYKGRYWFVVSGMTERVWGLSSYSIGHARHHGTEGTWRDAEDGQLGKNPIAQGSIDSTVALHVTLEGKATAYYWIGAGRELEAVQKLNDTVRELGPETILRRVRAYWRQFVAHDHPHPGLPEDIRAFYRRCLLIMRTQIDNRGAILAANDSDSLGYSRDSYSYLWPRDGALVAEALDLAGYHDISERFFSFSSSLLTEGGYFLHKYNPDGSVGSSWHQWIGSDGMPQLPIQEDETALVLFALWEHFAACRDIDFIRTLYRPLIEKAGDFLAAFRDTQTGLPHPTWDLWEERRGVWLFTVAATWAGLQAAARFAEIFGDTERADRYRAAAEEIKAAADERLYDRHRGRFLRGLVPRGHAFEPDEVIDSSQCGIFLFGMYPPDDPRVVGTVRAIEASLWSKTEVGGIARYERDPYYQIAHDREQVPGNPWFLCTLWLAQWQIAMAKTMEDLQRPMEIMRWAATLSLPSGVMAEQADPFTGAPVSVSPLTWSHATFVTTVCRWEDRHAHLLALDLAAVPVEERTAAPVTA